MTIERINTNLDTREKIRLLNEQILEVNGKVSQGKFNVNEIVQMISDLGLDRKWLREVALGNTYSDYTSWTHVKAEAGYSIWKLTPANYAYNLLNELYLDDELITNKGQASAETASSFDKVFDYDDSETTYNDNTTESATEEGTEFNILGSTSDYLYVGLSTTFTAIKFEFKTRASNVTLQPEYWNGSAWTQLDFSGNTYTDRTSNFESDGLIEFTAPGDWATTTVNSVASKYWIRFATSTTPVTVPQAYYIIPGNSVPVLLALSSDQTIKGQWAWCSYSGAIYVTIRNTGASSAEGNYFITSSSSNLNKQNYFIANHAYKLSHEDSSYSSSPGKSSMICAFASSGGVTLSSASTAYAALFGGAFGTTNFNSTSGNRQHIIPYACTIKNLYIRTTDAQHATGDLVFTIRKNGSDTGVTLTIDASDPAGTYTDLVNTVTFAAGDLIDLKAVNNASDTSATINQWSVELEKI